MPTTDPTTIPIICLLSTVDALVESVGAGDSAKAVWYAHASDAGMEYVSDGPTTQHDAPVAMASAGVES